MNPRAGRWEILGAWLHVWTPPREVEVPPVPWRKVVAGAALLAAVLGGAAALIVPAVQSGKRRGAARDARSEAAFRRAETARLRHDQRVHTSRARTRAGLLAAVEASVTADARARVRRGELDGRIIGTARCTRSRGAPAGRVHFDCLAPTATVVRSRTSGVVGHVGYPFVVSASLRDLSYAWCKDNPQAGEGGATFAGVLVPLPSACTA
jgi:hypothetical protein